MGGKDIQSDKDTHCNILREMHGSLLSSVVKYQQAGMKLKSSVIGLPV